MTFCCEREVDGRSRECGRGGCSVRVGGRFHLELCLRWVWMGRGERAWRGRVWSLQDFDGGVVKIVYTLDL